MIYLEKEIKVLNVTPLELATKIKALGAVEVFNGARVITHFDTNNKKYRKENKYIKLTEEGKLKLSFDGNTISGRESIKFTVSRKQEAVDFLSRLGLVPVAESTSQRTSFEWEGVDFDIDEFPQIPAFLEIDVGESNHTVQDILKKLNLENNETEEMSTPDIYTKYGLDYFEVFKIQN